MRFCDEILELLSAALDNELTSSERMKLDAHLDVCPTCRALFAELSSLREAAGEPEEAPAGFAQQVMEQISAHPAQERPDHPMSHSAPKRIPISWRKWAGWAAVVAIVVLAAVTLPDHLRMGASKSNNSDSSGEAATDMQESTLVEGQIPALDSGFDQEETNGGISAQADLPEKSADSFGTEASHARTSTAYCGVLVLTSGPLPEGLENYGATEDEEGQLVYEVPAEYYFSCTADLIEENASNFVSDSWTVDPAAEYGLIVVEFEP